MASLKKEMSKGVFWSAIQKYSSIGISIVVMMVLARILSPEQFGVVAISTVAINFLTIFSTMGIAPAIIQRKDLNSEDYNNIYTFSLVIGLLLSIIFFFLSKVIADFYEDNDLLAICRILTVSLFFASANMVPNALMSKDKRFKELAIRTLVLSIVSGVVSIVAALLGFGIYSLLITPIFNSIGIFLYNKRFYPLKISRRFSIRPIKKIFTYSIYQFSFEISIFLANNLDKLLIGKLISSSELGFYDKAHNLMKTPTSLLTSVVSPVIQPFMSRYQDDMKKMVYSHNKIVKILSTLSFPISVILYFSGSEIIKVFFGMGWERAVPCFKIFALVLPVQMILSTSGAFWQSTNSTNYLFGVGLFNTLITLAGYIISSFLFGTIEAIAYSYVISYLLAFFVTYFFMYRKVFKERVSSLLLLLRSPLLNAFILGVAYFLLQGLEFNYIVMLIIKLMVGFLITISYIQISGRYDLVALVNSFKKKQNNYE